MVVGGLPEPNKTHAADVCNQAIDMMMCAQKVTDPTNPDKSITVCLYIHVYSLVVKCVCVCVCVCICVCLCTYMHACFSTSVCNTVCSYMCVRMCINVIYIKYEKVYF